MTHRALNAVPKAMSLVYNRRQRLAGFNCRPGCERSSRLPVDKKFSISLANHSVVFILLILTNIVLFIYIYIHIYIYIYIYIYMYIYIYE